MDRQHVYAEKLNRYVTAMRNEKPDRVPIRPFAAEFTAKYAGYDCQQVTHDYNNAFAAARKTALDFDWDAAVGNMVYVWTGLTQAIGLRYYGVPGIDVDPNTGFQYLEPPENQAFMREDEYDALIDDPVAFLYNVWLPRVSRDVVPIGQPSTYRNNLSFVKGGMAMLNYFMGFGTQGQLFRDEVGCVGAISGIFKAPFDIIADKLRGYIGLMTDIVTQPDKVLAACVALMPHLLAVALSGADPEKYVPIGFWMHRGCVPFISHKHFETMYWATLKPIIQEIWAQGHQVLFYAEGDWTAHLERFCELPERSIVFHCDQTDIQAARKILGNRFCISGGIPNYLLTLGTPQEVSDYTKKVIDTLGPDGGYIMDASAIIQNDAKVENVRAMTDTTREYGVYGGKASSKPPVPPGQDNQPQQFVQYHQHKKPGVCIPWDEKRKEISEIKGDEQLVAKIWEDNEALAYTYIWHCLLSF
ncbi:MAG TPA: uroporphyrinogen decarboxylase family protein [Candidatus Bathyarchaeia archaeon]|nr:uroporphyrinogen decarboxylase family protein [Candidatus Bathyarchaeia archaeon]